MPALLMSASRPPSVLDTSSKSLATATSSATSQKLAPWPGWAAQAFIQGDAGHESFLGWLMLGFLKERVSQNARRSGLLSSIRRERLMFSPCDAPKPHAA
jgi:hypothetical protein